MSQDQTRARAKLDASMERVLRELMLCSAIPAVGYNTGGGKSSDGNPGGNRPPGDTDVEDWRQIYGPPFCEWWDGCCQTNEGRRAVIAAAFQELESMRTRPQHARVLVVEETWDDLRARIVNEGQGWSISEVARHMRCTERMVVKARREEDRDTERGYQLEPKQQQQRGGGGKFAAAEDAASRDQRIRALRGEKHLTIKQIAMLERVHPDTVKRVLRKPMAA